MKDASNTKRRLTMKRLACIIVLATLVFGLAMPKQSEAGDAWVPVALIGGIILGAALSEAAAEASPCVYYTPEPVYACPQPVSVYAYAQPVPVYVNPPHYRSYTPRVKTGYRHDARHAPAPQHRQNHRR